MTDGGKKMKPNIGIKDPSREAVGKILNTILADEYLLYTKTRNYHWNVVGLQFNDLHKFFETQYEELDDIVDDVAERGRALGIAALGSLGEFLKQSRLKEQSRKPLNAKSMIIQLLNDHETIIRLLREDLEKVANDFHDIGTNDFLTGVMEKHEKMAWMLRAFAEA